LRHNSALDFGCGIGRLTQALAPFFKNTHGVDISSSMIEQADKHNQFKNSCFYHVNCEDNLKMFRDNEFDFIYSHIALQHTSSASQISYLKEFARLLAPGGVILIQLIEFRSLLRFCPPFVYELYRRLRYLGRTRMDMNGVNRNQVKAVLTSHGLNVLDIQVIEQQRWWLSLRYYATKKVD
jgi:ubiquinone/menaquinone biosynthesis C-methylase UbiE